LRLLAAIVSGSEATVIPLPELDKVAKRHWTDSLEDLLHKHGLIQATLGERMRLKTPGFVAPDKSSVSRFFSGNPSALTGWFVRKGGEKARAFEKALGLPVGELRRLLDTAAAQPGSEAPGRWHWAFPSLSAASMTIAPPLESALGASLDAVVAELLKRLPSGGLRVHVLGAEGSGRKVTAAMIVDALCRAGAKAVQHEERSSLTHRQPEPGSVDCRRWRC
jgi:hypothetical protein